MNSLALDFSGNLFFTCQKSLDCCGGLRFEGHHPQAAESSHPIVHDVIDLVGHIIRETTATTGLHRYRLGPTRHRKPVESLRKLTEHY